MNIVYKMHMRSNEQITWNGEAEECDFYVRLMPALTNDLYRMYVTQKQ